MEILYTKEYENPKQAQTMKIEGIVDYVETEEIAKGVKNYGKYYRRHLV